MQENPQDVNKAAGASTSDGAARPNGMTALQWLERVLFSGQVSRVAQHLALVIFNLAQLQTRNGVSASMRDLERITGWGRSTLSSHLAELDAFVHVQTSAGRAKTLFELQGMIEDAIGAAIASGLMVRAPVVASQQDTKQDAVPDTKLVAEKPDDIPDTKPDTKFVASQSDTTPDAKPKSDRQPERQETARSNTTRATNESPTEILYPLEREAKFAPAPAAMRNPAPHMNGVGFVISELHGLVIPAEIVSRWQTRFSAIPDLEAQMAKLASYILKGGIMHPGWTCPEGWMAGCLSKDNQRAVEDAKIANAKIASAQRSQPRKTFAR